MKPTGYLIIISFILAGSLCFTSCKSKHAAVKKEIVKQPEQMDDQISDNLRAVLQFAKDNNGKINDSIKLFLPGILSVYYDKNDYHNIWSSNEKWLPVADSMFDFINNSSYYGLFPADYHMQDLAGIRQKLIKDTLGKTDAIIWTKAELMLSDAFMKIAKDINEGRIIPDSVSITRKQKYIDSFFVKRLDDLRKNNSVTELVKSIEPFNSRYLALRSLVKNFVDSMDTTHYQYITYPENDSLTFIENLQNRLEQARVVTDSALLPDSILLSGEIKKYQDIHGLKKDGKISQKLIDILNNTDREKFKRIAITLDRYKSLPDSLPKKYIWVNMPAYYLELRDDDTIVIRSKVIVGKPATPTPALYSAISDMVTYPQWTIPESIIKKDILPGLKNDAGYLARKGFNIVDSKGEIVDPFTVNWSKYTKGIPWKVMQGSGDDNALGVLKFNFNNPYSVYLHDTNERYLFGNSVRALSHGCVRVQKWKDLAFYIARNDSLNLTPDQKLAYTVDSIKRWLALKDRKRIIVKNRLPLFIEYFTCESVNNKLVIYDDIYRNDEALSRKYFSNK